MLDTLKTTATGLDSIPSWFLKLGAPIFAAPVAQLFNQSVAEGTVPRQWRTAIIKPIPKISKPTQPGTTDQSQSHLCYPELWSEPLSERPSTQLCFNHCRQLWILMTSLHIGRQALRLLLSLPCYIQSEPCCRQIHMYAFCRSTFPKLLTLSVMRH